MHPAIALRWQQMVAQGYDPGEDYGYETIQGEILEHPTSFGTFRVYTALYPGIDSAWFEADAFSASPYLQPPPGTPPPPGTAVVHGMDVSNFQDRDLTELIRQYDVHHVVVRLWLPEELPDPGYSLDQIWSAQGNGCTVGGYWWGYRNLSPEQSVEDAYALWQRAGVGEIPVLWPDIEPYEDEGCPNEQWTNRACRHIEELHLGSGAYLADWVVDQYWMRHVGDEMKARTVWLANHNGRPELACPSKYWDPSRVLGHQYQADPVDLNVFDVSVTEPSSV